MCECTTASMKSSHYSVLQYGSANDSILYVDLSTTKIDDELQMEKSAFYSLSRILSHRDSNCITILIDLSEDNLEWAVKQTTISKLREYFPFHFSVVHVVVRNVQYELLRYPLVASRILSEIIGPVGSEVYIHSGNDNNDFIQSLESAGFVRDCLPISLRDGN
jgi:hypothetical protein